MVFMISVFLLGFGFCLQRFIFSMSMEGEMVFVLAYSGGVFSEMFEGGFSFTSAYSGGIFSKTFEGVSFRTGLRG